jgi:hypothetical protein
VDNAKDPKNFVYFLKLEFDEGKQAVLVVEGKT